MCLLGDEKTGQAAFASRGCGDSRRAAPGRDAARHLGMLACGGSVARSKAPIDFTHHAKRRDGRRGDKKLANAKKKLAAMDGAPASVP